MKLFLNNTFRLIRMVIVILATLLYIEICGASDSKELIGVVTDSITGEPLEAVMVYIKEKNITIVSDGSGVFRISNVAGPKKSITLTFSSVGYKKQEIKVLTGGGDTIKIKMIEAPLSLDEVVIGKKRNKYTKKNNPAVELFRELRNNRDVVSPASMPFYSYDIYEKLLIGGNNVGDTESNVVKKKGGIDIREYIDTAPWTGKRILDLALFEKVSTRIGGEKIKGKKEFISGLQQTGIVEMLPFDDVKSMLDDAIREIDINKDDINLLQNRFVSPLSKIGADFYMYHLTDTVYFDGDTCIELTFAPKTPETFGFNGKLYIPLNDSVKYVKRVSMRVPKAINLNYIDNIFVSQNFKKDSLGRVHKTLDDVSMEFSIIDRLPSLFASRQTIYENFSYNLREDFKDNYSEVGEIIEEEKATKRDDSFWNTHRKVALSHAEKRLLGLPAYLRSQKLIRIGEKAIKILFQGYVGTLPKGSKFDIGPVNTFLSYDDVEGLRVKVGGMTTAALSDRVFFRGYTAYGFKDRKWKYNIEGEYSFIPKNKHSREYPMNSIRATFSYDLDRIGVHYVYSNPDNVILSIKREKDNLMAYRKNWQMEYNLEFPNHFSINPGFRYSIEEAGPFVPFVNGDGRNMKKFNTASLFLSLRYAPGEQFVQGVSTRRPINMDAPIFTLTQEYGPHKLWGTDFSINKTEVSFAKRFWLSAFGYVNVLLKGGKIWSKVPFPLLLWQNANMSYTIQQETFALLNPMEFAMDQCFSWDLEYFINGAIFNRIPLIKKAKLREVVSFKGFWGSLTPKNNPACDPTLYSFPSGSDTYLMGKTPYMEISAGLDNILTVLRLDYVWRLTYLNHTGIDRSGIRISLHLSF